VLSGSDGTLKMWDIRDGSQVRDLLTGIVGVWQVVFEGRWCVAASNRQDATMLDVWDFANENGDEEWEGEPAGGMYDEDSDEDDDDDDDFEGEADPMDQDFDGTLPSDMDDAEVEERDLAVDDGDQQPWEDHRPGRMELQFGERQMIPPPRSVNRQRPQEGSGSALAAGPSNITGLLRAPPNTDETPTRPRIRSAVHRRR